MADLVFNISKGRVVYYATLPAANDALIMVPIESSGIEADATLRDYDDLASLLAGTSNEQATIGRKTLTGVAVTIDDTADTVKVDCDDVVWTAAAGNALGALIVCYDPDTTTGTDSSLIPLLKYDFAATLDGTDVTAQVNGSGLYGA